MSNKDAVRVIIEVIISKQLIPRSIYTEVHNGTALVEKTALACLILFSFGIFLVGFEAGIPSVGYHR